MTNNKQQTVVQLIIQALDIECKSRGMNVYWDMYLEMEKKQIIDFASWIAKSEWMSIWVVDKWMWECQKENSNTNYKTDKELFDIYYNETYGGK